MKKITKLLIFFSTFVMTIFISIGFANFTDDLNLKGNASIKGKPYQGVYIKNIEIVEENNANVVSCSYILPTNVSSIVNTTTVNSSVTYKITVHNNTNVTYWYFDQHYTTSFESNSLLNVTNGISVTPKDKPNDEYATFNNADWVPPQTERDFYVTYTFGSNAKGYTTTLINYHFDIKMDSVYDGFLAVLNDKITETGYNYLSEVFDERYAEDGTTIIGNIGEDKEIFNNIFGGELTLNINGEIKPVTVLVRRDNVDGTSDGDSYEPTGPSGCEYTLYLTVDDLSDPTGQASVYVISYSSDSSGQWYQLAQLYQGTANKQDYGLIDGEYEGSIDTSSWLASANSYEVADGIVYKVGQEQGDQYDKMKTVEDLMSTFDQDIFNDIDNSRILKKIYDILQANIGSTNPAVILLKEAFENASPYYNNLNNGQEFKIKRDSTRAELIPYILKLQEALDYYYQTV